MKYPIDVEKYILAMRTGFGAHEGSEEVHREAIPLINDAYQEGKDGNPNIFLEYEDEMQAFAAARGQEASPQLQRFIKALTGWGAEAYQQGRQDAQKAVRA